MRGLRFGLALLSAMTIVVSLTYCDADNPEKSGPLENPARPEYPSVDFGGEETDVDTDSAPVIFAIDFSGPSTKTGRLIGWNIGRGTLYAPPNDPLHPEWRTPPMTEAFRRLATIRTPNGEAPLVRFSGLQIDGMLGGDGYHFWDFVKPDRVVSPDDNMATFQYHAIMDEIGGEGLITLNFGSATALEAAAYVRHLNSADPDDLMADARRNWGYPDGWNHTTFEIGNEVFGWWNTAYSQSGRYSYANADAENGGDPAWRGRPAQDPANFSARALAYVNAVLAVEPRARFWVPLSQASMDAWGGADVAVNALSELLIHPAVEAVVIHQYQVDDAAVFGFWDKNSSELLMAGGDLFAPLYDDLRHELDRLPRSTPLKIAVTEYHVAGAFSRFRFNRGDQPVVGLGIADMMISFAKLGVDAACQHMAVAFGGDEGSDPLVERWYNPFRLDTHGALVDMPSFEVTRMIADALLGQTVPVRTLRMKTRTYSYGQTELEYASVDGAAFVDAERRNGSIVLLNRVSDADSTVDVKIDQDAHVTGAVLYAPQSLENDTADAVRTAQAVFVQVGTRVTLDLPRHSLTVLRVAFDRDQH